MQIIFEYHEVAASDRLEKIAQEKLLELKKKFDFVHRADVFFKSENRTDDNQRICEIRLSLPGPRLHASSNSLTFEDAISDTVDKLESQLKKRSEKMT